MEWRSLVGIYPAGLFCRTGKSHDEELAVGKKVEAGGVGIENGSVDPKINDAWIEDGIEIGLEGDLDATILHCENNNITIRIENGVL